MGSDEPHEPTREVSNPSSAVRVRALLAILVKRELSPAPEIVFGGEVAARRRGNERYRRAALSAIAALGGRGLAQVVLLLSVPLALNYLGRERYGMWLTISSMIALVSFADLGLGYGLLNRLTRSLARSDTAEARREISSSIALLSVVAVGLAIIFAVAYGAIPWPKLLGVSSAVARNEAGPAVAAFAAIFLISLPISAATQVRVARQEAFVVHIASAVGNALSIAALIAVIRLQMGVPALVVAMAGPPALTAIANAVLLFTRDAPGLIPSRSLASTRVARLLMRAGFLFLVLQMAITVAFASDTLIIAQLLGSSAVAQYGVAYALFSIPIGLVAVGLTPLWPAYGEAVARSDRAWIISTLRTSLRVALLISIPIAGVGAVAGTWIISWWAGPSVSPPLTLLVGLAIWTIETSVGQAVAMFLNGANEIRLQAAAAAVMALANVVLSAWLTTRIGVAGVVWGTVISYGAFVLVPMAVYVPRVLKRLLSDDERTSS